MENGTLNWSVLGQQVSLGILLGLAVGYVFKKAFKAALIIGGVLVLVLLVLQNFDLIEIHWANIEVLYESTVQHPEGLFGIARDWAEQLKDHIPVAGSFVVGFLIGLKIG